MPRDAAKIERIANATMVNNVNAAASNAKPAASISPRERSPSVSILICGEHISDIRHAPLIAQMNAITAMTTPNMK